MARLSRRELFSRGTAMGSAAIGLMLSIPAIGFVLSPLFGRQRLQWVGVGSVDSVPVDRPTPFVVKVPIGDGPPTEPVDRVVYVVRPSEGEMLVLSNTCTHMQCNVHWDADRAQFLCPCHGGLYDLRGRNTGGPPPAPLPQWVSRVTTRPDGTRVLEIQNQYREHNL